MQLLLRQPVPLASLWLSIIRPVSKLPKPLPDKLLVQSGPHDLLERGFRLKVIKDLLSEGSRRISYPMGLQPYRPILGRAPWCTHVRTLTSRLVYPFRLPKT